VNQCNIVLLSGTERKHKLNTTKPVNHATQSGNSVRAEKRSGLTLPQLVQHS